LSGLSAAKKGQKVSVFITGGSMVIGSPVGLHLPL